MRIILTVLVLIFNLQSLTKADDIRDFLIENVSIDDSLLNYFSKDEIENKKYFLFESKKWATFLNISSSYEIYQALQITFDNEDHKYKIHRIDGMIAYENNIDACNEKKRTIVNDIVGLLSNTKKRDQDSKHFADKSGKSFVFQTIFDFPNGYSLVVECYDWEGELEKEYMDKLVVGISSKEFIDFVDSL